MVAISKSEEAGLMGGKDLLVGFPVSGGVQEVLTNDSLQILPQLPTLHFFNAPTLPAPPGLSILLLSVWDTLPLQFLDSSSLKSL